MIVGTHDFQATDRTPFRLLLLAVARRLGDPDGLLKMWEDVVPLGTDKPLDM